MANGSFQCIPYRVSHVDMGLVDYDLCVPPYYPAASAKFPSPQVELARQWNTHNSSQPNPVHEQMGHPVDAFVYRTEMLNKRATKRKKQKSQPTLPAAASARRSATAAPRRSSTGAIPPRPPSDGATQCYPPPGSRQCSRQTWSKRKKNWLYIYNQLA